MKEQRRVETVESCTLAPTDVNFAAYWPEWLFLLISAGAPVIVHFVYHNASLFARSGALTVFFAAVAEFVTLNRANTKHLRNALRAKNGKQPRAFSAAARVTGYLSFLFGVCGTIVWAYGDLLYRM